MGNMFDCRDEYEEIERFSKAVPVGVTMKRDIRFAEVKEPSELRSSEEPNVFKKFDGEKLDLSLCPPLLLQMYAQAGTLGAKKYGRNNWKNSEAKDASRFTAAFLRHLGAFQSGEYKDSESGHSHLSHAVWQLVALQTLVDKYGYDEVMKHL